MGAFNSVVSDIKNVLSDWLNVRGGDVSDLPLSLINRAIEQLWLYRPWDLLRKTITLSLDSNNSTSLPVDFGRMIYVGYDQDGDGVIDWFFFNECRNVDKRYDLESAFSTTTGFTLSIRFPKSPINTTKMRYVVSIGSVTNDTDYLFFPAQLVLRTAQKIHAIDKSISGLEVNAINQDYDNLLRDYEQAYYHIDRSMEKFQQDNYYNLIDNNNYSLDGNITGYVPNRSNSTDL